MTLKIHPYRLSWSFRIARLYGIDIRVHFIFILLLVIVSVQAALENRSLSSGLITFLLCSLLFTFVLLHELGHSLAAKKLGIRVIDITLWPLGGLARLGEIPEIPAVELRIALAGPAVNFAIVLMTTLFVFLIGGLDTLAELKSNVLRIRPTNLLEWTFLVNAAMGFLNLIPAFPLDGGRILRAIAARRVPYLKATELAVRIGKMMALVTLFYLLIHGLIFSFISLICLFVYWAGSHELAAARERELMKAAARWQAPGWGQGGTVLDAEVLSASDGEDGPSETESGATYRNLSDEDLKRYLGRFEKEFLDMVERYRRGTD